MKIKMQLLSDVIFGNGVSVPGGEDISVLRDENGFPYYKGSTFKGILREEVERYLVWNGKSKEDIDKLMEELFGNSGDVISAGKLIFSDFQLSAYVRQTILNQMKEENKSISPDEILDLLTNIRTFTSVTDEGVAKDGSLRMARCVNKGMTFYSEVACEKEQEKLLKEVITSIKWLGSMRNRGFGKVKFIVE